ncbi:MAG: hydrogenase nickel incorporation protein HypB [Lachnospiraceae bacterium]|nr:hydrogenase nickel incorporation protein HypB [Lachnospiraceae bacterium]
MKTIELKKSITEDNDADARALRGELDSLGITLINLMSSPGAGKTTLVLKLIEDLKGKIACSVMEADIASDVDAVKIEKAGGRAIQVHTDGMCHMDALMTKKGFEEMKDTFSKLIFLENVGNLICPAEYDTGAHINMMVLSIPEGDDKPLKYPLMFSKSDILAVTKIDTIPYFDFDKAAFEKAVYALNPDIKLFYVSAKTGEGMKELEECLIKTVGD